MTRPTTIAIDLSVACHQLHGLLVEAEIPDEHYKGFIKAQLTWMMSLDWLGELKPSEPAQVVLCCDTKPYWRSEYLTRPDVIARIPKKVKGKEAKRLRLVELLDTLGSMTDEAMSESIQGSLKGKPQGSYAEIWAEAKALADELKVVYKGGRKFPEYSFTKLKKNIYKICSDQGWQTLHLPGYEADDMAASLVALNSELPEDKQHDIMLVTVDADWMGLVNPRVSWFCMYGWYPRLRAYDSPEFASWAERRMKVKPEVSLSYASDPRLIWAEKTRTGDKSDNLPPGSPIEVIDLLAPPDDRKAWNFQPIRGLVSTLLASPQPPEVSDVAKASEYLRLLGTQRFIRTYSKSDQVNPKTRAKAA